jgi:dethiobiotin synthetase
VTHPEALRGTLVVTGTGTGVGKTVVTAAIAALALAHGDRVAVVKPAQTGTGTGDVPDMETVERLSGITDTHELARFPDPLSPEAAARAAGLPPLDMTAASEYIAKLAQSRDLGTLNHTALTCEALAARKITGKGVVIGSWPRHPGLAERANMADLETVAGGPLAGVLPEGSAGLGRPDFLTAARSGLMPRLGGARTAC